MKESKEPKLIDLTGDEEAKSFSDTIEVINLIENAQASKEFMENPYGHCTAEELTDEALAKASGMTVEEWEQSGIDELDQMLLDEGIDPDTLEPIK